MKLSASEQADHIRAEEARQIIENPLVVEALSRMDRDIFEAWAGPGLSAEDREELYRMHATLHRFIRYFDACLQNGAAARQILGIEESQSLFERVKAWIK